jgi:hypothetical protein
MNHPIIQNARHIPVSPRAAGIGLVLAAVIGLGDQYAADRMGYVFATYAHLPTGCLIPFLLLVLIPNLILKTRIPGRALSGSELIGIFSMALVASMMPDWGVTRYMISAIAAPAYFASPENRWDEYILPHLPSWTYLTNQGGVAAAFYEGLKPGQSIPWGAWIIPLFWWLSLITAVMLVGACVVTLFRKQWVEYERLRFPMGEVALQLTGETRASETEHTPPVWSSRVFQIGFMTTFLMMASNCVSYWGVWPHLPIAPGDAVVLEIHPAFPGVPVYFNIYVLCFAFFAHVEILFSLWALQLFAVTEQGLLNLFGVASTSSGVVQGGVVGLQYAGGVLVFAGWMVWVARHHLAEVWRAAFGRSTGLDERDELFSYRTAVVGLALGYLYIVFWLYQAGLSLTVGLCFLFVFFIFYLALARVTAESGLVMAELTVKANGFTVGVFGSASLSMSDLATMGMANGFARNWRTYSMIGFFHAAWLKNHMKSHQRGLFFWLALSMMVSVVLSIVSMIHSGYSLGANNMSTTPGNFGVFFYASIPRWAENASRISALEILYLLSGVALNGLIIAGRYLAPWWPLHPIGMAVGDVGGVVRNAVLPIFLAWLIQTLLLRFGGPRLYRRAQPFFIGMLVGFTLGVALSFAVDLLWFPDTPHETEWF